VVAASDRRGAGRVDGRMEAAFPCVPSMTRAPPWRRRATGLPPGWGNLLAVAESAPGSPAQRLRGVERVNFLLAYQGEDDRLMQATTPAW